MERGEFKYLWDQSSSPYTKLLASPGQPKLTGWKKVRPCAEYNLISRRLTSGPSKKPQNREYKSHRRTPPPLLASSYMSGELDENYSYVYSGGLSKRCRSEISRRSTPVPSISQWNVPNLSTVYLNPTVPQPPNIHAVEAQLQSELSSIVAMQTKQELLAEQIIIKNKLWNIGCSSTPPMHNSQSLELEGLRYDSKSIHYLVDKATTVCQKSTATAMQSKCAPSVIFHPQHAAKVKKKKQKSQLLEWWKRSTGVTPGGFQHRTSEVILAPGRRDVGMSDVLSVKANTSSSETTITGLRQTTCASRNSSGGGISFSLPNFVPCAIEERNQMGKNKSKIIETSSVTAGGMGIRPQDHVTLPAVSSLKEQRDCGLGAGVCGGLVRGKHAQLWHQLSTQHKNIRSST